MLSGTPLSFGGHLAATVAVFFITLPKSTHERGTSRSASKSDKNAGISMFKVRGSMRRDIKSNVSFNAIFLFKCTP